LAVAQGMLLWQPVKFGRCSQTSPGTTFTLSSAFNNGLADCKSAFKRLNGNNPATSCTNVLKRAFFAAIQPQFDDDLDSSRWRSETDWKIAILISAE